MVSAVTIPGKQASMLTLIFLSTLQTSTLAGLFRDELLQQAYPVIPYIIFLPSLTTDKTSTIEEFNPFIDRSQEKIKDA
jgi:hypothetical protein